MDELLSLFQTVDLNTLEARFLLGPVASALDCCPEDDPRYPWLVVIEEEVLAGRVPVPRLRAFVERFPLGARPDIEILEDEFRQMAENMTDSEWRTSLHAELMAALDEFYESGDRDVWIKYLRMRRTVVHEASRNYASMSMTPAEVTAETAVGHKLLCEGIEAWLRCLDQLLESPESEEEALIEAEYGTRLLVAVQRLQQRIDASN